MIKIIKKTENLAITLLLLIFFMLLSLNVSALENLHVAEDNADADAAEQLLQREQIERQEQQLNANLLVKKANQNFLDKRYEAARDQCLSAITVLSKISPPNKLTETKITKIKDLLGMVYSYWASDILKQADTSADSGKLEEAISLCRQATEMNPKLKSQSDRQIEKLKKKIKYNKYKDITSESSFNPGYKKTQYNIDVLYEQGKKLYNIKDYSKAKNKFEEVLVLDPYNSNAIYYLKMTNDKIYYAGQNGEDVTSNKRAAEAEWKTLSPVIAKTLSGNRIDIAATVPIPKKQNVDLIQKKLDDIIIKHIAFEDVPIKTALMFLKRESKKLDPEGKGINIFIRINEKQESEEAAESEGTENDENWEDDVESTDSEEPTAEEEFADQYFITIVLDNVPLGKAIEYVCAAAGLSYNIGNYAVEISSSDILPTMDTVVFPIDKGQYISEKPDESDSTIYTVQLQTFFTEHGIKFPEGASAVYDSKISRLIVRNTPAEISKISKILTELNTNAPQVSISAKFVEIEQKNFEELGFEWRTSKAGNWENNDQINNFALVDGVKAADDPKYDRVFGANYSKGGFTFDAVVHALDQNEKINVLSAPKVTTLSGQKATIKMTTKNYYPIEWQEPTITTQTGSTGTSYYIPPAPTFDQPTEVGIIFFVTPFVGTDRYSIDLELEPQIQKFIGWTDYTYDIVLSTNVTREAQLKMPKFKLQSIKANLKVYDGETVVLGGVTKDSTDNTDDRIPILGDLPLFGRFFRSEIEDADKTNLLIFTKVLLVKPDGTPLRPKIDNGLPEFQY